MKIIGDAFLQLARTFSGAKRGVVDPPGADVEIPSAIMPIATVCYPIKKGFSDAAIVESGSCFNTNRVSVAAGAGDTIQNFIVLERGIWQVIANIWARETVAVGGNVDSGQVVLRYPPNSSVGGVLLSLPVLGINEFAQQSQVFQLHIPDDSWIIAVRQRDPVTATAVLVVEADIYACRLL